MQVGGDIAFRGRLSAGLTAEFADCRRGSLQQPDLLWPAELISTVGGSDKFRDERW